MANDAYQAALAGKDSGGGLGAFWSTSTGTIGGGSGHSSMAGSHIGVGALSMTRIEPAWNVPMPNDVDGGYYMAPRTLQSYVTSRVQIRGRERGVWRMQGSSGIARGDVIAGVGDFVGKTFVIYDSTSGGAWLALETSDTVPYS